MIANLSLKERWGYICPDIAKEFAKYESEPAKWIKKYDSINAITKKVLCHKLNLTVTGAWD